MNSFLLDTKLAKYSHRQFKYAIYENDNKNQLYTHFAFRVFSCSTSSSLKYTQYTYTHAEGRTDKYFCLMRIIFAYMILHDDCTMYGLYGISI